MPFADDIDALKQDSLDGKASERVAGDVRQELTRRSRALRSRLVDALDKPVPNAEKTLESESARLQQAKRDVHFDKKLMEMRDYAKRNLPPKQQQYYKETITALASDWEAYTPPFITMDVKFTKQELSNLPKTVDGMPFNWHFARVYERTRARLEAIVGKSYTAERGGKTEFRAQYRKELGGALMRYVDSLMNVYNGAFQVTFEEAYTRFMGVLGG